MALEPAGDVTSTKANSEDVVAGNGMALIFDCDGTLVDTEKLYMEAFNRAVVRHRGDGPEGAAAIPSKEVWGRDCSGRGLEYDSDFAVKTFGLGCSAAEFLESWKSEFNEMSSVPRAITLHPGFDELYVFLRSQGWKCAVASSSDGPGLRKKLTNGVVANSHVILGLDVFDVIVSNDDVTRHKPDPEIYILAASRLGVAPQFCWVVEDSSTGVLAGKNAGMYVVAVPNEYTRPSHDFSMADAVVDNMSDVVRLISSKDVARAPVPASK